MDYDKEEEKETEDNVCPLCGLRQYSDICSVCNIKIKEEDEKEKTKDDDDEYDWRERR